ncbi:porin [Variovorax dokdonensis]|uniref:Porin n=1 Tax=Variovorax dokdonensis TaxID=344883 RepID=A0ABT7NDQ8_9BURK|nr:porin [Variovorax dokdonensis]MDM0046078.1 porin [Variovorax dokdonensis]
MRRNSTRLAAALAWPFLCATASAQSTLQIYGAVDAGLRHETNAADYGPDGTPQGTGVRTGFARGGGGLTQSYWGIKGTEDLGGGSQALMALESRFDLAKGQIERNSPFFELSYVGLQLPNLGQFTLGRQYNVALEAASMVWGSNLWVDYFNAFKPEHTMLAVGRANNMLHYGAQLGDVVALAQYTFGEAEGSMRRGAQYGGAIAYVPEKGPLKLSGSWLRSTDDSTGGKFDAYNAGAQVSLGEKTSLQAGYLVNKRDNNFQSFRNAGVGPIELAALAIISPAQVLYPDMPGGIKRRQMVMGGVTYKATPLLTFAANFWLTRQSGYTQDFDGSASQFQLVAGYALSKRTLLYLELDRSIYRDGMVGTQLTGLSEQSPTLERSQTGTTVGIRHIF